ncbi:type I Zorya anti-phage system protein ZorA1 [Pseudomonas schmalbachii]|uniref:Anti-phage defense ZorAB system ZorA n=1 Tax=Pseudomonas schmalbachii TaxID=2816993 RepID=A0ABS3TLW1_9PSED|nr:type I Zorya anti-phage system protein ZorA1 [Pseudomonas schmalbachii]MBO3274108.1 anti-phage defense ZorAB system ZorA [Pseudomonas schmalbachii]
MNYLNWLQLWAEAAPEQKFAPIAVVGLVTVLCLWYLIRYFFRSFGLSRRLGRLTREIKAIGELVPGKRRAALATLFERHSLGHAWQEYAETLHDQFELRDGEQLLVRSRSTAGAAHFFTAQTVVETPLGTEFYKHLPGILTGIGIVGTFFGLMLGLQHFNPGTPEQVNASVDQLLKDVMFAFLGSFVSILASIAVTLTEKWRLARCYKLLETLTEAIDGLFDSGVGEEYLAELVRSSNESSIQTRQLKDSLVTDLREMLQNLVDTQVRESLKLADTLSASYRDSGQVLAEQIGGAIENSLKAPLEQIAGAVQSASGDQSGQVQNLLTEVLTAFMSKLESTFGQQFNGLHEMLGQSVAAMQSMQQGFNALVEDMRSASEASTQNSTKMIAQLLADMQAGQNSMQAGMNEMLANLQASISRIGSEGEGAGERMAKQLEKLFADSEARQQAMAENLQAFVESIKQSIGQGQQETMAKIAGSVDVLGEQLGAMFKQMEQGRAQMDQATKVAQVELHRGTREMVGSLEGQVKDLLDAVAEQNGAMQDTIKLLSAQTEQHLQSMQQGADKMRVAAERFDSAGQSVSKAGEATAGVLGAMQSTGTELVGASRELVSIVADYRNNREALNKTLAVIESVVASAHGEAAGRSQYLLDLKQQGERLQALNREVNEYLQHISEVLGKGFNDFTEGVDRSLRQTLGSLDVELHKAMTSLAGGVEGVKESLEDFSDIMDRIQRK